MSNDLNASQGILNELTFGLAFRLSEHPANSVGIDAGIFSLKTNIQENVQLGFGYDVTLSSLQEQLRDVGGFELSLVFQLKTKKKDNCVNCFKFDARKKGKRESRRQRRNHKQF